MMDLNWGNVVTLTGSFILPILSYVFLHYLVRKRYPKWRPLIRFIGLALLISWVAVAFLWINPYPPAQHWVAFIWTVLLAVLLLRLIDFVLFTRFRFGYRVPRLMRDILFFFLLLLVVTVALQNFFHLQLTTLITTSALVTVIIGLALQETLSNLFAGLSLNFENAFNLGDWIQVGGQPGQVVQMNWRSVHLKTLTGEIMVYPNAQIAREILVNYSRSPEPYRWRIIHLGLAYETPPALVEQVVLDTVKGLLGPDAPAPEVRLKDFQDFSILYEIRYPYRDYALCERFDAMIRRNLWYALKRQGIQIPFPVRTVQIRRPVSLKKRRLRKLNRFMRTHPLFASMADGDRRALARQCRLLTYARNETIIREGDDPDGMYLIVRGRVRIYRRKGRKEKELAMLGTGEVFGEMALLSDLPRSASVRADEDCEVIFIPVNAVRASLEKDEVFAENLYQLFESRKKFLETIEREILQSTTQGGRTMGTGEERGDFFQRIRHLFGW